VFFNKNILDLKTEILLEKLKIKCSFTPWPDFEETVFVTTKIIFLYFCPSVMGPTAFEIS